MTQLTDVHHFVNLDITILMIAIILPYIIAWIIYLLTKFISSLFHFGADPTSKEDHQKQVSRFFSYLFVPGALFRMLLVFAYLRHKGWEMQTTYVPGPTLIGNSVFNRERSRGFRIIMMPGPRGNLVLKDVIAITLICYIPLLLALEMFYHHTMVLSLLHYLFPNNVPITAQVTLRIDRFIRLVYYYSMLSLLFGGAPVPEETSLVVYYIITEYALSLLAGILVFMATVLVAAMDILGRGADVAQLYFWTMCVYAIVKIQLDEREGRLFRRDEFQQDLLLEMVSLL